MVRNRYLLKTFSIFCILLMLESLFAPTLTFSLTSGPTAPEATSFEPVDTSSMVDALTGDMTYNIPLLEVPGPSGGYPLSLSYHAGIMPNEEASWAGLGWTLNPGSISRSVSGYPDDYDGVSEVDRQVWEGGKTETTHIGVNVPLFGHASLDASLTVSRDTYRGFSVQENISADTGPFVVDESGNVAGITASSSKQIGKSLALVGGVSYNFSGDVSGGLALASVKETPGKKTTKSMIGINMSSAGNSYSIAGITVSKRSVNNKAGKISTRTKNSGLNLGVMRFQKSYQRYWIDETSSVATYGSLYFPGSKPLRGTLTSQSFDTYDLPEGTDFNDPNAVNKLGGTFVDYDNYSVNAQGVGGTMRPYHYYRHVYRQTELDQSDQIMVESYPLGADDFKPQFRFENEFTNRLDFKSKINNANTPFDDEVKIGSEYFDIKLSDLITGETGEDGFINHHLIGKSPIRYYTNGDINQFTNLEGFLECDAPGFNRLTLGSECDNQIGAFTITNESGVNYHFSLPAYSFDEYSYAGKKDEEDKDVINQHKRKTKYAYTWYLTAVTGPDYVDRNTNGKADQADYGYWVNFQYGKWTDNYEWRNPSIGVHRDLDEDFGTFSKGKKELYYLNSISTASHTALFIKEIRNDAKGTVSEFDEAVIIENQQEKYRDNGGHEAVRRFLPGVDESRRRGANTYYKHATSTMKLSKILLLKNDKVDLEGIESRGDLYDDFFPYVYLDQDGNERTFFDRYHYGNYVLDIDDYEKEAEHLSESTVSGLDFTMSYALCPITENSFQAFKAYPRNRPPSRENHGYQRFGKLTLESIHFLGAKGLGEGLIPPLRFEYDLDLPQQGVTFDLDNRVVNTPGTLGRGDIYRFTYEDFDHYFLVTGENADNSYNYQFLNSEEGQVPGSFDGLPSITVMARQTKNPRYLGDLYDIWGLFKSDYVTGSNPEGSSFGRRVSELSAKSVDVWSLRKIVTGVGSTITLQYEPDEYDRSVLGGSLLAPLVNVTRINDTRITIELPEDVSYEDVQDGLGNVKVNIVGVYLNPLFNTEPPACPGDAPASSDNCKVQNHYLSHWFEGQLSSDGVTGDSMVYNAATHTIEADILGSGNLRNITSAQLSVPYDGTRECCKSQDNNNIFLTPGRWPDYIAAAVVEIKNQYGGSIRARDITVSDGLNERRTNYTYAGGATSYEPLGMLNPELRSEFLNAVDGERDKNLYISEVVKDYNRLVAKKFHDLMSIVREIPGPNVLYEQIQIREDVNEAGKGWIAIKEYKELKFQNYIGDDVGVKRPLGVYHGSDPGLTDIEYALSKGTNRVINDESSKIGLLDKMIIREGDTNEAIVSSTDYEYQDANTGKLAYQGVINEVFIDARRIRQEAPGGEPGEYHLLSTVSRRVTVPWIEKAQTTYDRKTGITTVQENLGYDFYSGQLLEKMTKDSRGNYFMDVGIPAYENYPAMGPLLLGGNNMLSQSAGEERWKVSVTGAVGQETITKENLVSASVQTWSDAINVLEEGSQPGIWRKKATYNWDGQQALNPDGTYPKLDYDNNVFNYDPLAANSFWQKTSDITLYNVNSQALEAMDMNDQLASTRMDKNNEWVIATAALSGYQEMTYSGAEQLLANGALGGDVQRGTGELTTLRSHTGRYSLVVPSGGEGFGYTIPAAAFADDPAKKYLACVWVYLPGDAESPGQIGGAQLYCEVNGTRTSISPELGKNKSKSWYRVKLVIEPNGANDIRVGFSNTTTRGIYLDDFRVHPLNATMTSYVYDDLTGQVTYILDQDNLYTHYEYDAHGRLVRTLKEHMDFQDAAGGGFRADQLVNEVIYHYGNN